MKVLILKLIVLKVLEGVRMWVKEMAAGGSGGDASASVEAAVEAVEVVEVVKVVKVKLSVLVFRSDKIVLLL